MANIPIWPGSSSFASGSSTPFGFYDSDSEFQTDADKFALFASQRLGYPIVDIELQDKNFYTAFEEAVTTYGNELYAHLAAENYLSFEGAEQSIASANNSLINPNMATIIRASEQYGVEAGAGGNVTWYSGSIDLVNGQQAYDLNSWASSSLNLSGSNIEIKRVFYEAPPAIQRYFDPYAGTGTGMTQLMDSFGFGGYSPAINFLLMPINYDMQKIQQIEFNDMVRRSQYSFEIINNTLKLFPIPDGNPSKLFIEYILKAERNAPYVDTGGTDVITNISQVPYDNPTYSTINSIGRQWVFEYALALVKEILGYVRGKYGNEVPIPNANAKLNAPDLLTSATDDKNKLLERLRAYFDSTSKRKLLESRAEEAKHIQDELRNVPFTIYIG